MSQEKEELRSLVLQGDILEMKIWLYEHPYFKVTASILNEAIVSAIRHGCKKIVGVLIPFVDCDKVTVEDTDCGWMYDYLCKHGLHINRSFNDKGYRRVITCEGKIRYLYDRPY